MKAVNKQLKANRKADFLDNFSLTMLALPGILFIFVFNYIPLYGLVLPFKNYNFTQGFFKSPWVGFKNFEFLFNGDMVLLATRNTILYNLAFIAIGTAACLLLSLLLFEVSSKYVKTYQTILFLPHFVSWVVAAFVFNSFLDMNYGLVNKMLQHFGMDQIMWYNEPKYWPVIIVFTHLWKGIGYTSVIYYAALMGINKEYFEAAKIDGASKWVQMTQISLPFIQPIIIITTILNIGKILYGDFGLFYNVTLNSPLLLPTTDVIDTFVYRALMEMGDVSMAAAAGFYQSVVGFALVIITNIVVNKIDSDSALF